MPTVYKGQEEFDKLGALPRSFQGSQGKNIQGNFTFSEEMGILTSLTVVVILQCTRTCVSKQGAGHISKGGQLFFLVNRTLIKLQEERNLL